MDQTDFPIYKASASPAPTNMYILFGVQLEKLIGNQLSLELAATLKNERQKSRND
jgi:hypothetical protein